MPDMLTMLEIEEKLYKTGIATGTAVKNTKYFNGFNWYHGDNRIYLGEKV